MNEILPLAIATGLGTAVMLAVAARYRDDETSWIMGSWLLHLVMVAAQFYLLFYVYRGDAMGYAKTSVMLGEFVGWDPFHMLRICLGLIFQQESTLPFALHGTGSPSGSMTGVALLLIAVTGRALYAPVIVLTLGSCLGQLALYQAFREVFPRALHFPLLIATCYVPSVVFWSSSMLKEAVVMVALGPFVLSTQRVIARKWQWLPAAAASALLISLLKPYILLALIVATGAMFYASRSIGRTGELRIRPVWLAVAVAVAVAGVIGLGQLYPGLAGEELLDSIAHEQGAYATPGGRGGSTIAKLDPTTMGPIGQILVAPLALFGAWFRPSLLDVHNVPALLNALETTLLLVLLLRAVILYSPRALLRTATAHPLLLFSLAFACTLGLGVGLTTPNLGTLSRYRMPLVPFLAAFITVVSLSTQRAPQGRTNPSPSSSGRRPDRLLLVPHTR